MQVAQSAKNGLVCVMNREWAHDDADRVFPRKAVEVVEDDAQLTDESGSLISHNDDCGCVLPGGYC